MGRYLWSFVLFLPGYIGLAVGIFPHLVPYQLTIPEAAAAPGSQALLLTGALLRPVILGHTAYVSWVFRGKVKRDEGYR